MSCSSKVTVSLILIFHVFFPLIEDNSKTKCYSAVEKHTVKRYRCFKYTFCEIKLASYLVCYLVNALVHERCSYFENSLFERWVNVIIKVPKDYSNKKI